MNNPPPIASRGYAQPDVLVDCVWVAAHLDDPKVRLLESNEDLLLYETGHIPGTVEIDWVTDLNDAVVRDYDGSWTEWGNAVRTPIERP